MSVNILRFVIPKSIVQHITSDSTLRQALEKMAYHRYSAMPVLDGEGKYVGTLRTEDVFGIFLERGRLDKADAEQISVCDVIKAKQTAALSHSATMDALIESVKEHNFVPIVDDRGCFIGIILRRDILNFLLKFYNENEDS